MAFTSSFIWFDNGLKKYIHVCVSLVHSKSFSLCPQFGSRGHGRNKKKVYLIVSEKWRKYKVKINWKYDYLWEADIEITIV